MPSDTAAGPPEDAAPAEGRKPRPEIREEWLDSDAVKVVRRLRKADFTAYLVGGCVRDLLLGMHPKDFDVATSAHPNQVKATFRNSRLIGRRFRLAHVYYKGGKVIEVSTFRANPLDELTDLPQDLLIRHDNVFGNEEEDARRRDFTINGLFYDVDDGKVVDHVGGKADLRARLVRTIGDPDVRMREDPVRILRAIRFAAKCGLSVEARTYAAMKTHVAEIPRCAPPRVLEEVLKLLRSGASRRSFELLRDVGALRVLLPPVAEHLERSGPEAAERHLRALDALDAHVRVGEIPSDAVLLAALLAPLPRGGAPRGPIPKAQRPKDEPPPPETPESEVPAPPDDELDRDLEAMQQEIDEPEPEAPPATAAEVAADPAHAPLLEGALRAEELHDERLAIDGIPDFSVGGAGAVPWSLPQGVVAPEVVLAEMVRTARLPRRIAERARLILAAQPLLSGERKKRRFSPQAFAKQSIFPEALAIFELSVAATGKGAEQLSRWQGVFSSQDFSSLVEEPSEKKPASSRRGGGSSDAQKRRRRGGRRRNPPKSA
jgi:Poly A polymerase head domain/Probable RNA and SrmB- binding site of polymerase A/Polymerase A arginine-rich C-terminus